MLAGKDLPIYTDCKEVVECIRKKCERLKKIKVMELKYLEHHTEKEKELYEEFIRMIQYFDEKEINVKLWNQSEMGRNIAHYTIK